MKPGNPRYRVLYAVWAFLECLVYGGLIYGWGSLVYVLKDEGLYSYLCEGNNSSFNTTSAKTNTAGNDTAVAYDTRSPASQPEQSHKSCSERDVRLTLVFTIGAVMFCIGCFIMGQINFRFGTRISRLGALILFISGALMIAFTSNDVPWLVFPGLSLIGAGGITFLVTNMQISVLFPSIGSAIVGLFCGGFDASAGIQLLVKISYENGISRRMSYIILACTHLLTLVSTFFFLPKDFIKKPPTAANRRTDEVADDTDAAVELKGDELHEPEPPVKNQSLISCMLSPIYILHVLWMAILQLRFYFFLGSLNSTLEKLLKSREQVSHYTNMSMYVLMCGLFISPFAGFVCDFHTRLFRNSQSLLRRVLMPSVIPLALTTTLCIIMSGLILIEEPHVLYAVFVFLLFFRAFLYTLAAGYLSAIFPSEYFGIMYGILIITGGVISMFQYVLFLWAEASDFLTVNLFLLCLMFVTYGHPLYQWFTCRRAEKSGLMLSSKDEKD